MGKSRILIIEDESIVALDLKTTLEGLGHTVTAVAASGADAIRKAEETQPDLVLMDIMLKGDMDGVEAAGQIRERFNIPVVFVTANADDTILARAKNTEPYGYIIKPFKEREVCATVEIALRKLALDGELRKYRDHLEELVQERTAKLAQANELLIQSQKMEAIGRLAAGVAHDFNNLLTPIMGYAQLGMSQLPPEDISSVSFGEIYKAAECAASLTNQLLAFSRRQAIEPKVINLNDLISSMDPMVRRLLDQDIDLIFIPANDLGLIEADPGQLQQVILNLAVNAREALPNGGKLTLKTANFTLPMAPQTREPVPAPFTHIMLTVTDTGSGMNDEVKNRIFEPFFTTKAETKGTGLGLATCFGIIKQSGGHIEVYTQVGQGTTFKIFLPITELEIQPAGANDETSELPRGTETVLLAEDEPLVRNFVAHMLRDQGYTVLEAADGFEAISVCKNRSANEIQLVLTDIVMPLMSGIELTEQLRTAHPTARVLFMSGYSDRTHANSPRSHGDGPSISFIQKPFKPATLIRKVREVLDQKILVPISILG